MELRDERLNCLEIDGEKINYEGLNSYIKEKEEKYIFLKNIKGQRYIGTGIKNKKIVIEGTPGNALGAYLNGVEISVYGNCQDAVGDTMNNGIITIYGSCGDALGYSMRGGKIFVEKDAGYRVGIHMKEYKEQKPVIVIGGSCGNFLGEYQAGGIIIVLGIGSEEKFPIGSFWSTGIHGGNLYVRTNREIKDIPKQLIVEKLENIEEIDNYLKDYANYFNETIYNELKESNYYKISPNLKNPYKQLYVDN